MSSMAAEVFGPAIGGGSSAAEGAQDAPLDVWMMAHGLHYHPAGWLFVNTAGDPMEPVKIQDVTADVATAQWAAPVAGTWKAS